MDDELRKKALISIMHRYGILMLNDSLSFEQLYDKCVKYCSERLYTRVDEDLDYEYSLLAKGEAIPRTNYDDSQITVKRVLERADYYALVMLYRDVCGDYLSLHVGVLNEEQYQYAVMEIISELVNRVGFTKEEAHKFVIESIEEISATYIARERFARVIRKIAEIDA